MPYSRARKWPRKSIAVCALVSALAVPALPQQSNSSQEQLKQLSLEQLGDLEVTTQSKTPEQVWDTAAAIYVLTNDDIRRSGATSIPEVLRLVPGSSCSY